jgi:hypothetical protein
VVGYRRLPTVLGSAPRRWRRRHGFGPEQALERVVAACARLRSAVEAAGQARAACYAAAGKPVPPETAPPEAHITDLPREQANRHAEKTLVSVRAERIAVATAADRLPRGCRHPAERMTRVWDQLVWDRFYIHADLHLRLAEIEHAAWALIQALPTGRCPLRGPARIRARHHEWTRKWARDRQA